MSKPRNQLRIIGGEWRGRKMSFPDVPGLRPTPDRVRETVFNWLAPVLPGARCLDLFAGSGALGLEALSRGAVRVVLVDNQPEVIKQLKENLGLLQADAAEVIRAEALVYLDGPAIPFDVVFLDPPYHTDWLARCIEKLEQDDWLAPHAWIYLEAPAKVSLPDLPVNWRVTRSKKAGEVGYHLLERMASEGQSR
ncbi:MAG: 16S rRNA (guanine(966)-N(2))-methyltransferase RsmD [Thiohalomonadales bacterium]|nr:16S rRNA (guanine(966)-N(2))-methyltransferase RsmD [Thiohalomonadales bacterium]